MAELLSDSSEKHFAYRIPTSVYSIGLKTIPNQIKKEKLLNLPDGVKENLYNNKEFE
jgi:hypothetical protein